MFITCEHNIVMLDCLMGTIVTYRRRGESYKYKY